MRRKKVNGSSFNRLKKVIETSSTLVISLLIRVYHVLANYLHRFLISCGNHPVITGFFGILGIFGIILSIVSYNLDRKEASDSTNQVDVVLDQIKELESKIEPDNKIFLYEEKVEIYWNDWSAFLLRSKKEIKKYGQAELTIKGEGKTVDFTGTLSINCKNGRSFWVNASNLGEPILSDQEVNKIVPRQVVKNAYKLFCK